MVATLEDVDLGAVEPEALIDAARSAGAFVFDLETTGLHPHTDRIEGVAIYVPPRDAVTRLGNIVSDPRARLGGELRAWYPFFGGSMKMFVQPDESIEEQSARLRYERTLSSEDHNAWKACRQKPVMRDLRPALDQRDIMERLRPLFEQSPGVIAIAHNAKFDTAFLRFGSGLERGYWQPGGPLHRSEDEWEPMGGIRLADSMLADFLVDENFYQYGLKLRVKELFGHEMKTYTEVTKNRRQGLFSFMADEVQALGTYAMEDCFWTWRLFENRVAKLREMSPPGAHPSGFGTLERLFWNIDMKVSRIIEEMETTGVLIDWRWLKKVTVDLEEKKAKIIDEIQERIGWLVNPNSAPQVATLLFGPKESGGLGLPSKGIKVGTSGQFSTGSKEIAHLARVDPIVKLILDWRSCDTIQANFSVKLAELAQTSIDGRIRSRFNQTGTKIFRLSCVAADTVLETSNGSVAISELDLSDGRNYTIETHRGRQRRITDVFLKGHDRMFEVTLDGNQRIRVTEDHRFLTPQGWQKLRDLGVGDQLVVPGVHPPEEARAERTQEGTYEGVIQGDLHRLRVDAGAGDEAGGGVVPGACHEPSPLRRGVQGGAPSASVQEPLARYAREQARRRRRAEGQEAQDQEAAAREEAACVDRKGTQRRANRQEARHHAAPRSSQRGVLRDRAPAAATVALAAHGRAAACSSGVAGAGIQASCGVSLRGAAPVLPAPLPGIRTHEVPAGRHQVAAHQPQVLRADREGAQGSHHLLDEHGRAGALDGAVGCRGATSTAESVPQELPSRLRVSAYAPAGGSGRRVPRQGRNDDQTGRAQGGEGARAGLRGSALRNGRGADGHGEGGSDHRTLARITSIRALGVQEVWDITVEEDASYVAHGFVSHNSSDPVNLQNQPRKKNLIRKAFCSAFMDELKEGEVPDELLFGADYGQIELRVAAHLSGDVGMIEVYNMVGGCKAAGGVDACDRYKLWVCENEINGEECGHKWTPGLWSAPKGAHVCPKCGSAERTEHQARCRHVDLHQRTAEDVDVPRNPLAKNLNFGSLYRIGPLRFCQYADLYDGKGEARIEYAREVLDGWYKAYPAIPIFHEKTEASLHSHGWVAYTITGRERRLARERYKNEYRAVTQGIQFQVSGSAQDILKVAMGRIWDEKERRAAWRPPAERKLWQRTRFILQVHDEVIMTGPSAIEQEIKHLIKTKMEGAARLRVPLTADCKSGPTWDHIH